VGAHIGRMGGLRCNAQVAAADVFKKSSDPVSDWQSLLRPGDMNRHFIGGRAGAIRRHNLSAILAHHDGDIVMFDLALLHSRGLAVSNFCCGPQKAEEEETE
jgi:hypothetical protein